MTVGPGTEGTRVGGGDVQVLGLPRGRPRVLPGPPGLGGELQEVPAAAPLPDPRPLRRRPATGPDTGLGLTPRRGRPRRGPHPGGPLPTGACTRPEESVPLP